MYAFNFSEATCLSIARDSELANYLPAARGIRIHEQRKYKGCTRLLVRECNIFLASKSFAGCLCRGIFCKNKLMLDVKKISPGVCGE